MLPLRTARLAPSRLPELRILPRPRIHRARGVGYSGYDCVAEEEKKFRAAITATAHFLPDAVVANADMERLVNTSDEWIRSRTGIAERRFLPADEPTSTMASAVASELLARRGIPAASLDLIIVATITPDMIFPATACLVQHAIGASRVWAYDLSPLCDSP